MKLVDNIITIVAAGLIAAGLIVVARALGLDLVSYATGAATGLGAWLLYLNGQKQWLERLGKAERAVESYAERSDRWRSDMEKLIVAFREELSRVGLKRSVERVDELLVSLPEWDAFRLAAAEKENARDASGG